MDHQSGTPDPLKRFVKVAGQTRLFRRGAVYYFRAKVPLELRAIVGKTELRWSLETRDFKEGKAKCNLASVKADAQLDRARSKLALTNPTKTVPILTDADIFGLVSTWLIGQERRAEEWLAREVPTYSDEAKSTVIENFQDELTILSSADGNPDTMRLSVASTVDLVRGIPSLGIVEGSAEFSRLASMMRRAKVESLYRNLRRIEGEFPMPLAPEFRDIYAHTAPPEPPKAKMTLRELTSKFMKHQYEHNASTTPVTYSIPVRALLEVLGESKVVADITKDDIRQVGEFLKRVPAHVTQRHRGFTLSEAVKRADALPNAARLSSKTVEKYFNNVSAVFNFIEEDGVFTVNPVKGKRLRENFRAKEGTKRDLFTLDELNALFNAPLYRGCEDDEAGFTKKGPNHPRRAKFWVPLLALFSGCRMNELCQLYCEDVKERHGVHYIAVRTDLDDEGLSEKTLKTGSSTREVPVHPEILKIGFLEHVIEMRRRGSARLFPELEKGRSTERYSSVFSRWFARFVKHACGHKPKAVFHSFRHHFRTALSEGGVHTDVVEKLCGWTKGHGRGMPMHENYLHVSWIREVEGVSKVAYQGLDLSHLHVVASRAADAD